VITPRRTRLVRVDDLHAFRNAIAALCADEPVEDGHDGPVTQRLAAPLDTGSARRDRADSWEDGTGGGRPSRLVVVPTRAAARQLLRTLQSARVVALPEMVTRDQMYGRLHARLPDPPLRLSAFERDVIAQASARHALAGNPDLPFRLRPGLVAEILRFYDLLRRQSQRVQRFEELIEQQLAGRTDTDAGARRMLQQTRFLADAFREYDRRVGNANAVDEHMLRERLIAEAAPKPVRHAIVAVPDWIADPDGLYVADFDLLTRMPGLDALDIVATEAMLASGFHERLHTWLPGVEEISMGGGRARLRPTLMAPAEPAGALWFTRRDREEELISVARQIKRDRAESAFGTAGIDPMAGKNPRPGSSPVDRIAVVFKRPLPYLYLAEETLGAAGIPYRVSDALPLAAEPTAAALDLVVDAVASLFSRSAMIALLRSPHFRFASAGCEITRQETSALDRALSDARYLGELTRLEAVTLPRVDEIERSLAMAVDVARTLAPMTEPRPASQQLRSLVTFFDTYARPLPDDDPFAPRERRGRAAIIGALTGLADAHAAHDDPAWTIDDLAAAVRRWIEEETFVPEAAGGGVHLVDDQAARFGEFDDMTIVGVVEGDWPERPRRNIFYPANLMKALGWPSEKDRRSAAQARFLDLLSSASRRVAVSVITLDDEALVEPSSLLDEIPRAQLSAVTQPPGAATRVFLDEALTLDPIVTQVLSEESRAWGEMRPTRSPYDAPSFHGQAGVQPARVWSVSSLETYVACPFKFYAQHILRLEEEPDDEEVMDPRRQGQFLHEVFEEFFASWQALGGGAITPANLDEARARFTAVVDRLLDRLPPAEAGLERTRLLGSSAAAGLGEAVLRMEAERPVAVVERLLEHRLEGQFTVETDLGPRAVPLKAKVDRVDLLADGTFRLIDYKLGWPPQRARALQLPIYSLCAEQKLAGRHGRRWVLGEAAYLAFKGPRRVVPLFTSAAERTAALADAQQRLIDTIDAIERGEFPPTPDDVYRCETCSFAAVCRKDYVGDV
jgi:RecB family exonuclease